MNLDAPELSGYESQDHQGHFLNINNYISFVSNF